MVIFKKKFYFFKVKDIWFKYKFKYSDLFKMVVYNYVNPLSLNYSLFYKKEISHTLELSLLKSKEEIYSGFRSTYRNEINKAIKQEIITSYNNDINLFEKIYNEFANKKNIYPIRKDILISLGENLQLSYAIHDNIAIVAHAYIIDVELGIARLYLSGSKRLDDDFTRNIISNANKLLTYNDILYFKGKNYKIYDFGGYAKDTTDQSLKGINEFKYSFGGVVKPCISYYTYLYYFLKKVSEVFDKRYK